MEDEPGALDGVARVEEPSIEVVEDFSRRPNLLEKGAQLGLEEIPFDLGDQVVDPLRAGPPTHLDIP